MRILFAVQNFRQGWGGAPESVRLMANILAPRGVESDVFDLGSLHRNVEKLDFLPEPGRQLEPFDVATTRDYDAVLIVGPWQNPVQIEKLLKHRARDRPLVYLPRGGLGRIEFARFRDLKKFPYFALVERRLLDRSDAIVFSSVVEQEKTIGPARRRAAEHVIPDFFDSPYLTAPAQPGEGAKNGAVTCSFLAEISPRKGLLPLVQAFAGWSERSRGGPRVKLVVGGRVRPGSERHEAEAMAVQPGPGAEIDFVGAVPHEDRGRFYADTDLMIVSSHFESYGLTVLEALSAGCAVMSAPAIGALEYLPAHERLIVTDGSTPADFERGLERALPIVEAAAPNAREETRRYAREAIDAINARALDSWMALLG